MPPLPPVTTAMPSGGKLFMQVEFGPPRRAASGF